MIRFLRDTSAFSPWLLLVVGLILGTFIGANATDTTPKYDNAPSAIIDGPDAKAACGGGDLIASGPEIASAHVVVLAADGLVKRIPLDRARSYQPDDIWVIGVCRKDVRP